MPINLNATAASTSPHQSLYEYQYINIHISSSKPISTNPSLESQPTKSLPPIMVARPPHGVLSIPSQVMNSLEERGIDPEDNKAMVQKMIEEVSHTASSPRTLATPLADVGNGSSPPTQQPPQTLTLPPPGNTLACAAANILSPL